jgi:predicted permease
MKQAVDPWGFRIEGREPPGPNAPKIGALLSNMPGWYVHGEFAIQRVSPGYFQTFGIPLLRGRYLEERDTANAPLVTVINETMARKYWPDEDPVGQQITADMNSYWPKMTIVGVVRDIRLDGLDQTPWPEVFWPMAQLPSSSVWIVLRTAGAPATLATAVRNEIRKIDPDVPLLEINTMEGVIDESLWRPRFAAVLVGLFSALGVILASAGVYGVTSYAVSQRTREFGLRSALGASQGDILRSVIGRGMRLILSGVALGLAGSVMLNRLISSQLYAIQGHDPVTLVSVSIFLVAIGLAGCYLPARRAVRVDPLAALRCD